MALIERHYRPGSSVLETTWETATGLARLTDGMVADVSRDLLPQLLVVRRLEALEGRVLAHGCLAQLGEERRLLGRACCERERADLERHLGPDVAAFMITGGKIGQIIGRKRAFAIGCVIYGCGSFTTSISGTLSLESAVINSSRLTPKWAL